MNKKMHKPLRTVPLQIILWLMLISLVITACGGTNEPNEVENTTNTDTSEENSANTTDEEMGEPMVDLPETIKVGVVVPLTGRYAAGGDQVRNGYLLAMEDINAAGGVTIQGTQIPLELVILDDESDPTKTVQHMETLYSSEEIVAYLGGFGSDLHAAAASIAEKNKLPYLGVAFALNQIHQQGYQYLFSPFPKSPALATAYFDVFDSLDPKPLKIAIFADRKSVV